ncbi:MAG: glycosyltransferase family 39 protein, partial [Calditrichaeota bacterium]|nr:glycosyltransferase family 39 protein [Calditrichota bacterium]
MLREHRNLQTPLKQQFWQILPAVILLRLPLLLLPGAGRDEALYWYWAHHFELAYSPLLQIAIRLFEWLPLPDIWAIRLVSLVASGCSLWLLEQLLIRRKIKDVQRRWLLLALAVAPWQTYAGAILHPDMLLLATLLAFVYFSEKQGFTLAAISAGLAIWAKPSGILVIAIAIIYWLVIDSNTSKLRINLM